MEKNQKIYITAKDSDYLHDIIRKKDWQALIELASTKNTKKDMLFRFFQTDESKEVLKKLSEDEIMALIDCSSVDFANMILDRMVSLCDSDSKYTNVALKLMKDVYGHGGHLKRKSIVSCLPLNILKIIIDSRIPFTEFHFGPSKQEFFLYILQSLSGNSKKDFHYKNLKESDSMNGVFTYIVYECSSFPLERREVLKLVIQSFRESFSYIESNNNIEWKSVLINQIINPFFDLIIIALKNEHLDYKNDKEIIDQIHNVFDEFYYSKFFHNLAAFPILNGNGNMSLLNNAEILEQSKVIPKNYYYKVFTKAVQENKDNFIDQISRAFFTNCPTLKFIREIDDGIYKILYNAAIDISVRDLIERKRSENLAFCCRLLTQVESDYGSFIPRYEECLKFIKSVIEKFFDKKETLNVDVTSYPEICCYILNILIDNPSGTTRNQSKDISYLINQVNEKVHTSLNFLDDDMRNKLILGIIRHPVDGTKFSSIITSNNPTTLVTYICYLKSVKDIKLVLPQGKRNTVDKYGFRESKSAGNPKETCKMNLVEIFLHTLRFWENHDKSIFTDGYVAYYQFARKILMEAIATNDKQLKEAAINVYYRYSEIVSLMKNAKYIDIRIKVAAETFLTPLAVIVGSELDESFVEKYIKKYIQPFNAQSYHLILSETISRSHIDFNYEDDEDGDVRSEVDSIFMKLDIDQQYAISTKLLLELIKQNPVKNFTINYNSNINEGFFISDKRYTNCIKSQFAAQNKIILAICNPLQTEYPLPMDLNSPQVEVIPLHLPKYKISPLVFVELARFVGEEFKTYSPKLFKTSLTKSLIKIQTLIKNLTSNEYDAFQYSFTLDPPTIDTDKSEYSDQSIYEIQVLYSRPFFDFLNEIDQTKHSIFNDECYELIKSSFIARFVSEEEFLRQKNLPPPKFDGFDISLHFKKHRNAKNIFNIMNYKERVEEYKYKSYQSVYNLNNFLLEQIEKVYTASKMIGDKSIDDVFNVDGSVHRSRAKSDTQVSAKYAKNVHKCFTFIIDALNKCNAEKFANELDSLDCIENFKCIRKCGSSSQSYSMLTQLFDLLIDDFVSVKPNLGKMYDNRMATTDDIYKFMVIVASIASPNIGTLNNLQKLTSVSEKAATEKVQNRNPKLFEYLFKCRNIEQILTCMNSPLFSINYDLFPQYLLKKSGLIQAKPIINNIINEVSNNGKQILDDFHVALAATAIHPLFVGFPAPQSNLDYFKKITNRSLQVKRSACANAVYYAIMNYTAGSTVPLSDIMEIIESAHKKSPDEITAFFCVLISEEASLKKMNQLPALNDLRNDTALPNHFIISQGPNISIPKEIGDLYYNVIEKIILSGLKSKKSHIYELTVTVLNEINVGPEIHQIISPFIIKGLNEIQPSDDNEAFLKYATSFTMKNPDFNECFSAYNNALTTIKKHSFAILKANAHLNKDSPYPEPFKKLENSFSTIITAIEKPFIEFREENEMVNVSLFCARLSPSLAANRPAVGRDVYLRLESYTAILGDSHVPSLVKLAKEEKKEDALSQFLTVVTHHSELILNVPRSLEVIYEKLRSSFTVRHTIELSQNLLDSQTTLRVSMQRAHRLAQLLAPDVLLHMPEEGKSGRSEEEVIEILSNLGIFCKIDQVCVPCAPCETGANWKAPQEPQAEMMMDAAPRLLMKKRLMTSAAPVVKAECEEVELCDDEEFEQEEPMAVEDECCGAVEIDEDDGGVVEELGAAAAGGGDENEDVVDESEPNEDQVKDAFDIFS